MDYQEFCFDSEIVKLPVVQDPVTGAKYVRLGDIHDIFPGVQRILLEDMIVPFMVDSNEIKYEPKRVPHYPGRILRLVVPAPSTPLPRYSPIDELHLQHQHHEQQQQQQQQQDQYQEERDQTLESPRQRALQRSRTLLRAIEEQLHPHGPHAVLPDHTTLIPETLLMSTIRPASNITTAGTALSTILPERLTGAPVSTDLYQALQNEMAALRQLMGQNHDEVLENFLEVLKRQQQTMDRIALLQKRMEANISQVYELHEYPIPRLFIILPDPRHRWDPRRLLSTRFRLHFLCECGEHTRELVRDDPTLSRQPHHIHLAHHEGYELTRPNEFYNQYGPYLLGMLQTIKFGCLVAGIVIPPIAHIPAAESLQSMSQTLHASSKDLVAGIDASINYLERHLQISDPVAIYDRLSELSALEGADLRRLEHFIRNTDEGKTLGNLYRITTLSGHVKWVCLDHYRSNYRDSVIRQLLQNIKANGGIYDAHLQKIVITLGSSNVAAQFFERLVCAPGVDELELSLDYEFTSVDLTQLRNVLRTSSVQSLMLDGHWRKGPLVEIKLPGKKRYDGIAGMMTHERLRCLKLRRLVRFGANLSSGALVPIASGLKNLSSSSSGGGSEGSSIGSSGNTMRSGLTPVNSSGSGMDIGGPSRPVLRHNTISFLRSLHLLEKMDEDDQVRLATIVKGSPSLVDLRLGLRNKNLKLDNGMANATRLSQELLDAIATLPFLKVLHLHMVHWRQPTNASLQALRQIASYGTLQECKAVVYDAFSFAAQFSVLAQHASLKTFQLQAIALWRVGHFEKMQVTATSRKRSSVHLDFPDKVLTDNDIQAVKTILSGFSLSYLSVAMPTDLQCPTRNVVIPLVGTVDHTQLTSVRFSRVSRGVHGEFWVAYFEALGRQQKEQQQLLQENSLESKIKALGIQDKEKQRLSLQLQQIDTPAIPHPMATTRTTLTGSPFRKLKSVSLVQAHITTHFLSHIGQLSLCQLTLFYCSIDGDIPSSSSAAATASPQSVDGAIRENMIQHPRLARALIRNLDYSRLRLMAIIELGMDSTVVRAFQERACHFRRDLEIYVYDTEWSDLDVEQLSAPWPRWPKYSSAADSMPRSPQVINFSMYARNSTNFDAMELNSFYAKMKLY